MRERMPFAVVGSNTTLTDLETGLRYRGREYPWGCVNIEDKVRGNVVNLCKSGDGWDNMSVLWSVCSVKELLNQCCWRSITKPWLDIELIATSSPVVLLVQSEEM